MPSPFPGMDPYLEQPSVWQDFHDRFLPALADAIGALVLPHFIVKVSERLYVRETDFSDPRYFGEADVAVKQGPGEITPQVAATVLEAPVAVEIPEVLEDEAEMYLEIYDRDLKELVAVIELLSPANKRRGDKREQYLAKRQNVLHSDSHLVEIDLLRGGPRMPLRPQPDSDYCVLVSRASERPQGGVWLFQLRDPLPTIPIPLRPPFGDALVPLRPILDRIYDAAGYAYYIYRAEPDPPLTKADMEWAASLRETSPATSP